MPRWSATLVCAVMLVPAVTAAAAAQDPAPTVEDLGLQVLAGHGGRDASAPWTPVEVRLEPRRPVGATLSVEAQGDAGVARESRRVEVGAGSLKIYRFLVPSGRVRVVVEEADREPLTVRADQTGADGGYLVGMLGALPAEAPPLRIEPLGVNGTWVPVDPAWVALSPLALAPLGGLVAEIGTLADLSEAARRNLAVAVVAGTDLAVVADTEGPVDLAGLGLPWSPASEVVPPLPAESAAAPPAGLTPSAGTWVLQAGALRPGGGATPLAATMPAGRGRVSVVAVGPGAGEYGRSPALWSAVTGPSGRTGTQNSEWAVQRYPHQFARLLSEGGASTPALPWLAGFLVTYVLVVGPVNGMILARFRRRELAWVTVPAVTAIFTAAGFLGATGSRPPMGVASAVAWWVDGIGTEVVAVGARGPTAGVHEAVLSGEDWTARPLVDGGRTSTVTRAEDVTVRMDLTALQLGGVLASRTTTDPAPLEVEAVAGRDGVEVTVTNVSGSAVEDVVVRAGTSSGRVGTLAAGASDTVTVGGARLQTRDPFRDVFDGLAAGADGIVAPPASMEAVLRSDVMDGNPALVWAVGRSPAGGLRGVRTDGLPVRDLGRLVVVGARPALPADGAVLAQAVERVALADPQAFRPSPLAVEGPRDVHLRFRFPPGATPAVVYSDLDRGDQFGGSVELTVWDHAARQWLPAGQALPLGGGDAATLVDPLGQLYVRASGELFPFEFSGRGVAGVAVHP